MTETSVSQSEDKQFLVSVLSVTYRADADTDLDEAIRKALHRVADSARDRSSHFIINKTTVGGLPARRTTYDTSMNGKPMLTRALAIQDGPRFWCVMVIFGASQMEVAADRVLDSVKINVPLGEL